MAATDPPPTIRSMAAAATAPDGKRTRSHLRWWHGLVALALLLISAEDSWLHAVRTHCHKFFGIKTSVLAIYTIRRHLPKRLLIAELRQRSWPIDLFDPQSAPLRRLGNDGRLLGSYSVGPDGDDVHWLYGARDRDGTVHWGGDLVRSP